MLDLLIIILMQWRLVIHHLATVIDNKHRMALLSVLNKKWLQRLVNPMIRPVFINQHYRTSKIQLGLVLKLNYSCRIPQRPIGLVENHGKKHEFRIVAWSEHLCCFVFRWVSPNPNKQKRVKILWIKQFEFCRQFNIRDRSVISIGVWIIWECGLSICE